jgi:YfiH family protein
VLTLPAQGVVPDWPAPANVRAFVTTRATGPLVVGVHVPSTPRWLSQVHGTAVADLDEREGDDVAIADAAVTSVPGRVAVVRTADCLPVFICREDASRVAVAHAGWRGLAAGVLENTVAALGGAGERMMAWMGPAIGPAAFEVGPEVRAAFVSADAGAAGAFVPGRDDRFHADLYALARMRLARCGVTCVSGGGFCTFTEGDRFYSWRRARDSGRMGAFIWIEPA